MSGWRSRSRGLIAGVTASLVVAACGSASRGQTAGEARGSFPVTVSTASFPRAQRLAEPTRLVLAIRNDGRRTLPDVAVTICNTTCETGAPRGEGTSAEAFSYDIPEQPALADPSRPIWIVDHAPGQCASQCASGDQGGAVTAYANTWALGALASGQTARFTWAVTAVKAGSFTVAWQVSAGLSGAARAVLADGSPARGTFAVQITSAPVHYYVKSDGQVTTTPAP